ncbi:B12-binding domain-containing radical SAM protein [Candidatus Margulisiibacteriota bacterium]
MLQKDKKKKILLISPPFYRLMGSHYNGISLGQSYVASMLNKNGHEAMIYNADYMDKDDYLNQKQIFDNYELYKDILNDLNHPIWQEIRKNLEKYLPDVVGISMYTATCKSSLIIADMIKKINKETLIVVGGTHPSLDPFETIKNDNFDLVVRNEGEFSFLSVMNGENYDDIPGLVYKKGGQIISTGDPVYIDNLDSLPFPERRAFLNSTKHMDVGAMITGRGCPFDCTYCCSPAIWKRKVRFRSIENIIEELEFLAKEHSTRIIHFQDDTFTMRIDRAAEICRKIIDKKLNIQWVCDTRVDKLNKEILELMKAAGCVRVKIAVESGNEETLKIIKKRINKEKILETISIIKEVGIPFAVYLMIGFPHETNSHVRETIEFGKRLEADYYSLSTLAPYYGTEMYQTLEQSGNGLDKEHWEYFFHQSKGLILNQHIDPELAEEFFALNDYGKGVRV